MQNAMGSMPMNMPVNIPVLATQEHHRDALNHRDPFDSRNPNVPAAYHSNPNRLPVNGIFYMVPVVQYQAQYPIQRGHHVQSHMQHTRTDGSAIDVHRSPVNVRVINPNMNMNPNININPNMDMNLVAVDPLRIQSHMPMINISTQHNQQMDANRMYYMVPPSAVPQQMPHEMMLGSVGVGVEAGYTHVPYMQGQHSTPAHFQRKGFVDMNYYPPNHSVPSYDDMGEFISNIRQQIEYYFSRENLHKDMYLRGLMDTEGYVRMKQIMHFNRIKRTGASPQQVKFLSKFSCPVYKLFSFVC